MTDAAEPHGGQKTVASGYSHWPLSSGGCRLCPVHRPPSTVHRLLATGHWPPSTVDRPLSSLGVVVLAGWTRRPAPVHSAGMGTATKPKTTKQTPHRRPSSRFKRPAGYLRGREPETGLIVTKAPPGARKVTTAQIKALLADFP